MAPSNHPLTQRALNDRQVVVMKRLLFNGRTAGWMSLKYQTRLI